MLTNVNFSCGHSAEVNLPNNEQKRLEKIAELELTGLCPECRRKEYEKEDQKNAKTNVCARISNEKFEKEFSECKPRMTGFPKEKDYSYVFIPVERICAECIRKIIKINNCSYKEAFEKVESEFSRIYPDLYNSLKPVVLDDEDDLYSSLNSENSFGELTENEIEEVKNKIDVFSDSTDDDDFDVESALNDLGI